MRIVSFLLSFVVLGISLLRDVVWAAQQPVQNLHVLLRGKKYDVPNSVTTVAELQERVQEISGVEASQQGRVIFGGKKLSPTDILSQVGVSDGAQLNIVPPTSSKKSEASVATTATTGEVSPSNIDDASAAMQEYLKQAGIDTDKLDELVKNMGGGGADGEGMPSIKESMEMMNQMMNSPLFQEYMNDPVKLEESRQMILQNPMLANMMKSMPGMSEILNDADAWREAMQAAANLYKSLDTEQLMQAMMQGLEGMPGGMPPGLFDGTLDQNSNAAKALDELDEDD